MLKRFILLCCVIPYLALAETFTVLSYHSANPPYSYLEDEQVKGIFPDVFMRLSELTGHDFNFVNFSVARGLKLFEQGKIDIEPGVNPSWRNHSKRPGIYSEYYAMSREVVISSEALPIHKPKQLYGKVLGIVRGYRYGEFEKHFEQGKIVKVDSRSEIELLAQLNHGYIDFAIMGEATAHFYQKSQAAQLNAVMTVEELPVAMRLQPNLNTLREEINEALAILVETGEIQIGKAHV